MYEIIPNTNRIIDMNNTVYEIAIKGLEKKNTNSKKICIFYS